MIKNPTLLSLMALIGVVVAVYVASMMLRSPASPEEGASYSPESNQESTESSEAGDAAGPAGTVAETVPAAGFTVTVSSLPEAQQDVLRTLGYGDTITFTAEMVQCAEEKIGVDRVAAIKSGGTPTVLEVGNLARCL